jgi:mRNA interferase MazF
MQRGDVCWVIFDPPDKRRPAVILTRNSAIRYLSAVTVAPVSTTIRSLPTEVRLGPADGLPDECVLSLDGIHTVRKSRVADRIGSLDEGKMARVESALLFALGMDRYASAARSG